MLEQDILRWIEQKTGLSTHYQHLLKHPGLRFAWFIRNGEDDFECMDDDEGAEPDVVYFDLEIYDQSPTALQDVVTLLRSGRGFRGWLDSGATVEDISISDQRDDYEPQAKADSLPTYSAEFRLAVTGYVPEA